VKCSDRRKSEGGNNYLCAGYVLTVPLMADFIEELYIVRPSAHKIVRPTKFLLENHPKCLAE
jgi:hypothetical protein